MKKLLSLCALVWIAFTTVGQSMAAEKAAATTFTANNINGTWFYYIDVSNGPVEAVLECVVRIIKKKKVVQKSDACSARTTTIIDSLDVEGGTVKVSVAGKVTGQICLSTSCYDFIDARMTKDKQLVEGIGINGSGSVFSFSAVKR